MEAATMKSDGERMRSAVTALQHAQKRLVPMDDDPRRGGTASDAHPRLEAVGAEVIFEHSQEHKMKDIEAAFVDASAANWS